MRTGSILGQAELTERLFDEAGLGELTFLHRDVIVLEMQHGSDEFQALDGHSLDRLFHLKSARNDG